MTENITFVETGVHPMIYEIDFVLNTGAPMSDLFDIMESLTDAFERAKAGVYPLSMYAPFRSNETVLTYYTDIANFTPSDIEYMHLIAKAELGIMYKTYRIIRKDDER